jgi:tol-pal system protein YbgF
MKKSAIIMIAGAMISGCVFSAADAGNKKSILDGPLTQVVPIKNGGSTAATEQAQMPVPKQTRFTAKLGGAPTASAGTDSATVVNNLPPVVEASNAIRLKQATAAKASNVDQPTAVTDDTTMAAASNPDTSSLASVASNNTSAVASQPTVTNTSASTNENAAASSGTTDQRVARLEQQMKNLTQMNLPQQITNLQAQVQQLNGQLQVQEHDLKLLDTQQRNFYQDLDQRIKKLSGSTSSESSVSSTNSNNIKATSVQLQDSNAYKSAFDLLVKRKYQSAKQAFITYLNDFPNGQFTVNAHYWLGEIYMIQRDYTNAAAQFNTVVKQAPKSPRVPDARYKLALIYLQQGKKDQATAELTGIKKQYPNSTAARLAIIKLKQLNLST